MSSHVTDQAAALIGISHAVQKLVSQFDNLALSASRANHALDTVADLGAKLQHRSWLLETLAGHGGGGGGVLAPVTVSRAQAALAARAGGGGGGGGGGSGGAAVILPTGGPAPGYPSGNLDYPPAIAEPGYSPASNLSEADQEYLRNVESTRPSARRAVDEIVKLVEAGAAKVAAVDPGRAAWNKRFKDQQAVSDPVGDAEILALKASGRAAWNRRFRQQQTPSPGVGPPGYPDDLTEHYCKHCEGLLPVGDNADGLHERCALEIDEKEAVRARAARQLADAAGGVGNRMYDLPESPPGVDFGDTGGLGVAPGRKAGRRKSEYSALSGKGAAALAGAQRARADANKEGRELAKTFGGINQAGRLLLANFGEISKKTLLYTSTSLEAASPDAMSTLAGSFKLLFAQVGTTLVEPTARLAYAVQEASRGFDGLSPAVKKLVGGLLVAGAGASAVGMFLKASGLAALGRVAWNAAPAGTGGYLGKAGAVAAGAGALYGGARYYIDKLDDEHQANVDHKVSLVGGPYKAPADLLAEKSLGGRSYAQYKELYDSDTTPGKANFRAEMNKLRLQSLDTARMHRARYEALEQPPNYNEADGGVSSWIGKFIANSKSEYNKRFHSDDIAREASLAEKYGVEQLKLTQMTHYLMSGGSKMPAMDRRAKAAQDNSVMAAHGLLLDIQSRTQPSYNSVEDIYKKVQLEALAESPLQQEIREIQRQQLEVLVKSSDYLKGLFERHGLMGLLTP